MHIKTTELLDFLVKAQKLSIIITLRKSNEGYEFFLRRDWSESASWYNKYVFITNDGESTWDKGEYEFYHMNHILDKLLVEKEQKKKIKEQKRQEILARLTDEEKEILGIQLQIQ